MRRETSLHGFSPDGGRLLLSQRGAAPLGLITVGADGADPRALPVPPNAADASFAPDGRQIAFMSQGAIWRTATDGGQRRRLRPALTLRPRGSRLRRVRAPTLVTRREADRVRGPPDRLRRRQAAGDQTGHLAHERPDGEADSAGRPGRVRGRLVTGLAPARVSDQLSAGRDRGRRVGRKPLGRERHRQRRPSRGPSAAPGRDRPDVVAGRPMDRVDLASPRQGRRGVRRQAEPLARARRRRPAAARSPGCRRRYVEEGDFLEPQLAWQPLAAR